MAALKLILASASPRRRHLLAEAGVAFDVDPADVDETAYDPALPPVGVGEFLARAKAAVVAARHPVALVLAADTVVAVGDELLGKAETPEEARRILGKLSGRRHQVVTGYALALPGPAEGRPTLAGACTSWVVMRALSPTELEEYVASGLWRGKAGAYGIQDRDPFVTAVEGSWSNIVGLPMETVLPLLQAHGITAER
ncbi:MAG: Maf family protein [Phycisphaerae bacterium]